jgi:hypothetical protein
MRIHRLFPWIALLILLSLPISRPGAPADPKTDSHPFVIRAQDDLLTVRLRDISLEKVLTEIANQTGIQITFYGPMDGFVSADFSNLPFERGLKRLLRDFNHILIYDKGKGSGQQIRELIIYSEKGKGLEKRWEPRSIAPQITPRRGLREVTPDSVVKAMKDEDPAIREEAVDVLAEMEDEKSIVDLSSLLLNDKDSEVRQRAAEALGDLEDERAVDSLIKALKDKDAAVRETVVDALSQIGGQKVLRPLRDALRDEDEDVREAAAAALEFLTGQEVRR